MDRAPVFNSMLTLYAGVGFDLTMLAQAGSIISGYYSDFLILVIVIQLSSVRNNFQNFTKCLLPSAESRL